MTAAKERTHALSERRRVALSLAAAVPVAENSRLGFTSKKTNSHRGWSELNFKTVTGIGASLRRKGIRSRCQSLNRYAYVMNNPTSMVDPSGLNPCWVTDTCGRNGGAGFNDAKTYNPPCSGLSGFFGICAPNYSQEAAAAEAQYMVTNNLCFGGCGGLTYAAGGLTYTWVPAAQVGVNLGGSGTSWGAVSPGYWAVGSVNDLGFFGQLSAYANDAISSVHNWVTNQLTPPPGIKIGIIPPQALIAMAGGLNAEDLQLTQSAQYANRPYQNSTLLIQQIIDYGNVGLDPQGAPNAVQFIAPGSFNGSVGNYYLIVNPITNQIYHFHFGP